MYSRTHPIEPKAASAPISTGTNFGLVGPRSSCDLDDPGDAWHLLNHQDVARLSSALEEAIERAPAMQALADEVRAKASGRSTGSDGCADEGHEGRESARRDDERGTKVEARSSRAGGYTYSNRSPQQNAGRADDDGRHRPSHFAQKPKDSSRRKPSADRYPPVIGLSDLSSHNRLADLPVLMRLLLDLPVTEVPLRKGPVPDLIDGVLLSLGSQELVTDED